MVKCHLCKSNLTNDKWDTSFKVPLCQTHWHVAYTIYHAEKYKNKYPEVIKLLREIDENE
jgi:hypothetical protein